MKKPIHLPKLIPYLLGFHIQLAMLFISMAFLSACESWVIQTNCGQEVPPDLTVNKTIGKDTIQFDVWNGFNADFPDTNYSHAWCVSQKKAMLEEWNTLEFKKEFKLSTADQIFGKVVYFSGHQMDKDNWMMKDAFAIQVYSIRGNSMYNNVFIKNGLQWQEIPSLSGKMAYISTNDIYQCSQLFKVYGQKVLAVLIVDFDQVMNSKIVNRNLFQHRLEAYRNHKESQSIVD